MTNIQILINNKTSILIDDMTNLSGSISPLIWWNLFKNIRLNTADMYRSIITLKYK